MVLCFTNTRGSIKLLFLVPFTRFDGTAKQTSFTPPALWEATQSVASGGCSNQALAFKLMVEPGNSGINS